MWTAWHKAGAAHTSRCTGTNFLKDNLRNRLTTQHPPQPVHTSLQPAHLHDPSQLPLR